MEGDSGAAPATGRGGRAGAAQPATPAQRLAVRVPLLYAGVSAAWIVLSDAFVASLAPSVQSQALWSVAKGFGFVAVTTLALHAGLRWTLRREWRAREELHRKEEALGRYRLLAQHGRDVILFVRPEDGRILDANAAAMSTYGYTGEELRALTVFELRAGGAGALAAAQLAQADAGGIRFETVHRRKDGSPFPVEVSAHGSALDGVRVVVSVVRDVTERKRAEEALRESDERLALAVEAARLGTWHAVPWGPLELSPRSREILGVDEGVEIADFESYLRLVHPDDRESVRLSAERWLGPDGDGRYQGEYRCLQPDGSVRWVSALGKAEFAEVGGVRRATRLAGTLLDVTERKQVEARLMQADRLASVGMLAAGVAHEINNPLSYLAAALEFVEEQLAGRGAAPPADRAEVLQALADAREGAARVRHVVRDLTLFSRMREERRVRVDLRPIIEASLNMAGSEIRRRARVERDYGAVPEVLANEARLGQVVLNLLINAAHAIPEGHPEENAIRVVTATDARGQAVLEVRDTGSGIPAELVDRIFDPFFTTKPSGVGTGLGLSICRSIVVALGGEISARSGPGRGATFRVVLPPAPAVPAERPAAPEGAAPARGRRGRVLVVDDEPAVGSAVERLLSRHHEVRVMTRAEEARDAVARGERFDVILCDLMMPQMTGMELHAALARVAPDQARRMVVLTGGAFTEAARDFLARVALPHLEKPFDAARLRALVASLVG